MRKIAGFNTRMLAMTLMSNIALAMPMDGGGRNLAPSGRFVVRNIRAGYKLTRDYDFAKHVVPATDTVAAVKENPIISATGAGYDVVYTYADSSQVRRTGGTRGWRNCNPGCMVYSELARAAGAIGTAGGFAVFPDYETGRAAIKALLLSDKYRDLSIANAICRYAPPHENDTDGYIKSMKRRTGLTMTRRLGDLTAAELDTVVGTICTIEGWAAGRETQIAPKIANMRQRG